MSGALKEILVIGGTGAQGRPVVKTLAESHRYRVRVLTRNPDSARARDLSILPNVTLVQGSQDNEKDLHAAFRGVYGAWVNFDGFTIGEKNETFYGIRAYEIARHEGVKHYVWANCDYALKKSNWDESYHWGHNDAKGRIGDLILSHGQKGMKTSLVTVGPYMDMLFDGMYTPEIEKDGTVVWWNPAGNGEIPLQALEDLGVYIVWVFDNPSRSSGLDLEVATEQVSFPEIAATFTKVTEIKAEHRVAPLEAYFDKAEPYPGAPANFAAHTPGDPLDPSQMTFRENFTAWWKFWGGGKGATRNMELLDEIYPERIKTLEEWMQKVGYVGQPKPVLKNSEDLRARLASFQQK